MREVFTKNAGNSVLKETKQQFVYSAVKAAIINNDYEPGTMITERQICDIYDVSRTPVREALRQLANEGMVELVVGRGAFVAKMSFEDMIELFEVREALEKMMVKLLILKSNGSLNNKLKQCFEEQISFEHNNPQKFMEKDMEFHFIIAEGAKNKQLYSKSKMIYDQIKLLAFSSEQDQILRSMAHIHHGAILNAIIEGNVQKAEQSVIDHIR